MSMLNPGTSINFDGQDLQKKEEDEYRKEEEQQQNESLRTLDIPDFDENIFLIVWYKPILMVNRLKCDHVKNSEKLPVKDSDKLPVKDSDKLLVKNSDKLPVKDSDKLPVKNSHKLPVKDSDKLPVKDSDKLPVKNSDKLPVKDSDKLRVKNSDKLPVKDLDKLPVKDSDKQVTSKRFRQITSKRFRQIPVKNSDKLPVKDSDKLPVKNLDKLLINNSNKLLEKNSDKLPVNNSDKLPVNNSDKLLVNNSDKLPVNNSDKLLVNNSDKLPVNNSDKLLVNNSYKLLVNNSDKLPLIIKLLTMIDLRQLLTNAFDDLIDDDEFSVTSDEGGDSRNSSLHFRSRGNSNRATPVLTDQKHDGGLGSAMDDWGRNTFPGATSTPMIPQHGQLMTAPYGDLNSLRRSQELQQALQEYQYAASEGFHSGDFLSSSDQDTGQGQGQSYQPYMHSVCNQNGPPQEFNQNPAYHDMPYMDEHGNYHSPQYMDLPVRQAAEGGNSEPEISVEQHQYHPHYQQPPQQHGGYYRDPYEQEDEPRTDNFVPYSASSLPYSQGYHSTPSDMGYYTTTSTAIGSSVQNVLDTPVSRGQGQEPQIRGQGQLPVQQQNYDSYKVHYRKNKDLEMTSQEKIPEEPASNQEDPIGQSVERENHVRLSHDQDNVSKQLNDRTNPLRSSVDSLKLLPDREHPLRGSLDSIKKRTERERDHPLRHSSEEFILRKTSETTSRQLPEMPIKQLNEKQDKDYLLQEGNSENKQMAQLQILYKARGRKLEEMTNNFDAMKQEMEPEKEGASTSLKQCQDLLQESKGENAQVIGKLRATEAQVEAMERGKEEVMKKLQTAESTIETLNHQLQELGNSETLSRARHEHDVVVAGLQQKYEKEIKQATASKKIADDMCQVYQEELKDLKEQLEMMESATSLGLFSQPPSTSKMTCDSSSSDELITSLKTELERCLVSNKQKREQVSQLQTEIRSSKKELEEIRDRFERSEKSSQDCKKRLNEWEDLMRSSDKTNAVENRLRKDVENLKQEKQILLEDTEELKKRLEEVAASEEKLSEINRELNEQISQMKDKLEDKLKVEMENKLSIKLDNVAMAKVEWFEEQRSAKQAAIDNALKLAEAEWKLKLEESIDTEVEKRIAEAKSEWVEERRTSLGTEVQQQINKEKENWEKLAENNFEQRLKREKELWEKNSELEMKRAVDKERVKVITRAELDLEVALQKEQEKWKRQMNTEIKERLEKEKKEWEDNAEVDMLQKIHAEKEKWNKQRDHEIQERLEEMKLQLTKEAENKFMEKLEGEKAKLEEQFIERVKNRVSTEKEIWKNEMEAKQEQEVQKAVERAQKKLEETNDQNIEKIKSSMEETVQERIQAEVSIALEEAKKQWNKDHDDQMNSSLSATEAAKSVLQEEIDKLESEKSQLQNDLRQKDESWIKEKEEIVRQKDVERKAAVAEVQDQCEKDYEQFTKDHHATLTQALKTARDQHNKEKTELSNRHAEELQKYKDKEKQLLQQLQDTVKSPKAVDIQEVLENERKVWEEENLKLREDVDKRDQLLEKADTHLSEEIEKLRSELETAYQKRLESEVTSAKQKFELEVNRSQTFDQKEKGKMQNQIQELKDENAKVKGEFEKVKGQMQGEIDTYKKEVLELKENLFIQIEKSSMAEAIEKEMKSNRHTCELLQGENEALLLEKMKLKKHFDKLQSEFLSARTEIENYKQNYEKIVKEIEIERGETSRLKKGMQKLETEMEAVKTERDVAVENIKNLENAYKKDIATHKQKQEEMNSKLQMAEKVYNDKKQQFMSEVDNIKQCLTTESNVALETMKNKMVEMQKSHMTAMESLKEQNQKEVDELQQKLKNETEKSLSSIEDVLRHITETNLRAAETVKCEIGKQRRTTLQQLKKIYMDNVRKVLQNEIIGANIESKLQDIEQALEALSGDEQDSGRPVTPGSESSRANTPTPSVKSNYSQRSVGSHSSMKNHVNSNKKDYDKDYDGERYNSFNTSNFSDYDGHYKQEEVISPREKYSSREVIHKRHPGKSHQREHLHRNITTRSGSPNRDYTASSEGSDQEFSNHGLYENHIIGIFRYR
ncbi:hypothetical protein KUTeg_015756 [Tegillarca granosa]|uniref:CEP152 CEP63 binding coiled coil domain-containing protein n=1 Tax=Tegillarca granosa TaxID=220873 RepID=A0ABQ9ESY2_TEGGR|nr:hypothetical protein KUTeg_015756 [Tegillarca granosa]